MQLFNYHRTTTNDTNNTSLYNRYFCPYRVISNFFFIFFEEANNELNQSQSGGTNALTNWENND